MRFRPYGFDLINSCEPLFYIQQCMDLDETVWGSTLNIAIIKLFIKKFNAVESCLHPW
jgi:hypothetical protein